MKMFYERFNYLSHPTVRTLCLDQHVLVETACRFELNIDMDWVFAIFTNFPFVCIS